MSCASLNCKGFRMFRLRACPDHKWLTGRVFLLGTQINSEFCASQQNRHQSRTERLGHLCPAPTTVPQSKTGTYPCDSSVDGPLSHLDQVPAQVICRKKQTHYFLERKRVHGRQSIFTALFGPEVHDICHACHCHMKLLHISICACHHKHECYQQSFALLLRLLLA